MACPGNRSHRGRRATLNAQNQRRTPKRVKIDDVRRVLGDDETDRLLAQVSGRPARRPVVTAEQLQTARYVLSHWEGDERSLAAVIPVVRAYLQERSPARKAILRWVERELENALLGRADGAVASR